MIELIRYRLNSDFKYVKVGKTFVNPRSISHIDCPDESDNNIIQIIFNNGEHINAEKSALPRMLNSYK